MTEWLNYLLGTPQGTVLAQLLEAIQFTIYRSLIAFAGDGLVGALITLVRISRRLWAKRVAIAYNWFFQSTPLLMLLLLADLGGYTIGLTGGTLEDLALTEEAPEDAEIIRFGDNAATLAAYTSGQVDVLVTGNTVAAELSATNPDLGVETKFILRNSPCLIGVKQGNIDLLQWVNVLILTNKLSDTMDELAVQWFGEPLPDLPTF